MTDRDSKGLIKNPSIVLHNITNTADSSNKVLLKKPVLVLQDITIKSRNSLSPVLHKANFKNNLICQHSSEIKSDQEVNNVIKHRRTVSTYIFDEEPVFSDSDEEEEYSKQVLETQNWFSCAKETHERPSDHVLEIQCNLTSNELKILDVIKKCASIDIGDVNEDFKQIIDLCKLLQYKYRYITLATPQKQTSDNRMEINESIEKEIFCNRNTVTKELPNTYMCFQDPFCQEKLLPSRNGDSSNNYSFETVSFDNSFLNISSLIESIDSGGGDAKKKEKENKILRRSSRIRKLVNPNNLGLLIIGKKRYTALNKKRARTKTKNYVQVKNKSSAKATMKKDGDVGTKRKTKVKATDNIQIDRDKNHFNHHPISSISMSNKTVNTEDTSRRVELSNKQVKSLARNWMKPNNSVLKNASAVACKGSRRLYSPEDWLHSEDLTNLCKINDRSNATL